MIPPSFSDLGKAAKDLFEKKFKFGLIGFECNSNKEPVSIKLDGSHDMKSKVLTGSCETKHDTGYGFDITTKWTTKNILSTEITRNNMIIDGLKATTLFTLEPDSGKKSLKVKNNYKRDLINLNSEFFFTTLKPIVNLNVVIGCTEPRGYLAGADIIYDTHDNKINRHTMALSYLKNDFTIVGSMQNFSLFNTLVHQRVSKCSDIGINVSYNKSTQELKYGIVGQYKIPTADYSLIKAKIDQSSKVGLAYCTTVKDGIELSLCAEIDCRNFEAGPHNIGIGVSYGS